MHILPLVHADNSMTANETLTSVISTLLILIELKSTKLYLHSQQVANYAVSIAAKMRLPRDEIERIRVAALLHDVGLLAIPSSLLAKIPYFTTREMNVYKNHCNAGNYMLENIPDCHDIVSYIRYHHECWNGKGYPQRLKGVNIPLGSRIISVANHYDRYINPCIQHWVKTRSEAVRELNDHSGTIFDPEVVKAFCASLG